jgi:hypothetical protein
MALLIEQTSRDLPLQRTPIGPERTQVVVRPGDAFRFVDDTGQVVKAPQLQVRRLDNNLIIDGLPDGQVVELNNFFGSCRPGAECTVNLEGLGAPAGTTITEESPPASALADGSFLLYAVSADASAAAALPVVAGAAQSGTPSAGVIGAVAGGLALAGLAGAGGGGGDDDDGPAVDTTAPGAPVVTSGGATNDRSPVITGEAEAGARITLRIDVNGNGTFTDAGDATYTAIVGADGRWTIDTGGAPQFGALPPGGLADGATYTLLIQAADAAGNASPSTRTTLTIDTTPPAVPLIDVIAGDDILNAAERAAGLSVTGTADAGSTVVVTVGTATASATTNAAGAWSTSFTPAQIPSDGLVAVRAVATDAAGNASAEGSRQIVVETTVPGAPVITDDVTGTATGPVTFTITFDKPVLGVTTDDVIVTGGTKGAIAAVSASVYTLVVTPIANVQSGQLVLQLPAGAGVDVAGNPTAAASPVIQAFDTLRPTVSVTDDALSTAIGPVTFTFVFSEAVTGFAATDVAVTGGTRGALTGSGTTYSLTVTPPAGANGSISVNVPAGVVSDAVGLTNTALAAPVVVPFDTAPPSVSITDPVAGTANGPVTFTFTFSEPVTEFAADDIATGATVGSFAGSGAVYTAVLTPPAGTGTFTVAVPAGAAIDTNGNASTAAPQVGQPFDTVAPTVEISDPVAGTANAPVTFTFTFSEPVSGFTAGDIATGATVGSFAGSGAVYTAVLTPPAGSGTFTVDVAAGAATDGAGNPNTAAAQVSQPFVPGDTTPPTLAISASPTGAANGPITYTFSWSEPVTGFVLADIGVTGNSGVPLTAFGASGSTYTATYSPALGTTGTLGLSVGPGVATDAAGNANTGTVSTSQVYDRVAPTVDITSSAGGVDPTNAPVTFTFTMSEAVVGFDASDVDLSPGVTITTPLAQVGGSNAYTLTATPPANELASFTVSVAAGTFTDAAGNANAAGDTVTQPYDTQPPGQTVTFAELTDDGFLNLGPSVPAPSGSTTNDRTPSFTLLLSAPLGVGESVVLELDGNQVASTGSGSSLSYQDVASPLGNATYTFTASIRDALGNAATLDLTPAETGSTSYVFTVV